MSVSKTFSPPIQPKVPLFFFVFFSALFTETLPMQIVKWGVVEEEEEDDNWIRPNQEETLFVA